MVKHIVFENYNVLDYEDEVRQSLIDNGMENPSQEEVWNICYEDSNIWFENEESELKKLSEGSLIAIAEVGRWNGRFSGYKDISSLVDTLYTNCDYEELFVDSYGNLRKRESHHDGTNSILYRYWKEGITETQKDNFRQKIYEGNCTNTDIYKYTRKAGKAIAELYGWKVR